MMLLHKGGPAQQPLSLGETTDSAHSHVGHISLEEEAQTINVGNESEVGTGSSITVRLGFLDRGLVNSGRDRTTHLRSRSLETETLASRRGAKEGDEPESPS